jgi:glutamate---cysteine ligase / carboxylate-amine ligase
MPHAPSPRRWSDVRSADACRAAFDEARDASLGIEEELLLVDGETFDLVPAAGELLVRAGGDERFAPELSAAQVEVVTPVCGSAPEALAELAAARRALLVHAGGLARLVGCGYHPFAREWADFSPGRRYGDIAQRYRWAARRGALCAGLHVHVGVRGGDRALAVWNALRGSMPELLALAANAPFAGGRDTGLATVRPKVAESLPRQGVAPALRSLEAWAELVARGERSRAFADASQIWWECRLHPAYGTLEMRVPDAQAALEDAGAVAAVAHALVARLCERHDAGERLPAPDAALIAENRWLALRDGAEGTLIEEDGAPVPTRARLERLVEEVAPQAARLGGERLLARAAQLVAQPGWRAQREVAEAEGLTSVVARLADLTEAPLGEPR